MNWGDFFKGRKSEQNSEHADRLREALFDSVERDDSQAFHRMCCENRQCILSEFCRWLKVPQVLRSDPNAIDRYGRGLLAVAEWFARGGESKLLTALQGEEQDNPVPRWEARFGEAATLKLKGHFAEAIAILREMSAEMGKCHGGAVEKYLPMVHGSLGECYFRSGQVELADKATRSALDRCMCNGDVEGVIVYSGNLAEICQKLGEGNAAKYWLVVTTNAMIQTGQVERAVALRRTHGLGPTAELLDPKKFYDEIRAEK